MSNKHKTDGRFTAMRVNPIMIWTTIGALLMCAALGIDNLGSGIMAFGAYLLGLSTDIEAP